MENGQQGLAICIPFFLTTTAFYIIKMKDLTLKIDHSYQDRK